MKKSVTKTLSALCIALSIFIYNSMGAFAYVCPKADNDDKVHEFSECRQEDEGYTSVGGVHAYLVGYDEKGFEI